MRGWRQIFDGWLIEFRGSPIGFVDRYVTRGFVHYPDLLWPMGIAEAAAVSACAASELRMSDQMVERIF
jgi:hypothetical protein